MLKDLKSFRFKNSTTTTTFTANQAAVNMPSISQSLSNTRKSIIDTMEQQH